MFQLSVIIGFNYLEYQSFNDKLIKYNADQ